MLGAAVILLCSASTLYSSPLDSGCELKMMKMPGQNVLKTDDAGKKCKVDVPVPLCRGFCKTSEEGTHRFPSSHHNSSVCAPKIEKMEKVSLTDCEEGFDPASAWVEVPVVSHCHCQVLAPS